MTAVNPVFPSPDLGDRTEDAPTLVNASVDVAEPNPTDMIIVPVVNIRAEQIDAVKPEPNGEVGAVIPTEDSAPIESRFTMESQPLIRPAAPTAPTELEIVTRPASNEMLIVPVVNIRAEQIDAVKPESNGEVGAVIPTEDSAPIESRFTMEQQPLVRPAAPTAPIALEIVTRPASNEMLSVPVVHIAQAQIDAVKPASNGEVGAVIPTEDSAPIERRFTMESMPIVVVEPDPLEIVTRPASSEMLVVPVVHIAQEQIDAVKGDSGAVVAVIPTEDSAPIEQRFTAESEPLEVPAASVPPPAISDESSAAKRQKSAVQQLQSRIDRVAKHRGFTPLSVTTVATPAMGSVVTPPRADAAQAVAAREPSESPRTEAVPATVEREPSESQRVAAVPSDQSDYELEPRSRSRGVGFAIVGAALAVTGAIVWATRRAPRAEAPPPPVAPLVMPVDEAPPVQLTTHEPAAPATAPTASCSVTIRTNVPDANVWIDGARRGAAADAVFATPCNESATVEVRRPSFEPFRKRVVPKSGDVVVEAWLEREKTELTVVSEPQGAEVTYNGVVLGKTPLVVKVNRNQQGTLWFRAPNFVADWRRIVPATKTKIVTITLKGILLRPPK